MRPEQPPGWTATRRRRSSRPSCSRRLRTLSAAGSLSFTPCAVWVIVSLMFLLGASGYAVAHSMVTVETESVSGVLSGSRIARVEPSEEQRFGEECTLEDAEMQRLVRAVRTGVGVLDARHEDLRLGELVDELRDERDGAADADLDGGLAPGIRHRSARLGDGPPARVDEEGLAGVDVFEGEPGPERRVRHQVGADRLEGRAAVLPWRDAGAHPHAHTGNQRVRRVGHVGRVDAGDGD